MAVHTIAWDEMPPGDCRGGRSASATSTAYIAATPPCSPNCAARPALSAVLRLPWPLIRIPSSCCVPAKRRRV